MIDRDNVMPIVSLLRKMDDMGINIFEDFDYNPRRGRNGNFWIRLINNEGSDNNCHFEAYGELEAFIDGLKVAGFSQGVKKEGLGE